MSQKRVIKSDIAYNVVTVGKLTQILGEHANANFEGRLTPSIAGSIYINRLVQERHNSIANALI